MGTVARLPAADKGTIPVSMASELFQGCSSLPPLVAWNGSWNEWPRISSAISASRAVCRAVYAGSGPTASSRASRNA